MAAITTIQNLLVTDGVELLGYWNNSARTLVLNQIDAKNATKKPPPKNEPAYVVSAASSATGATGKIMDPSALAGFMYNNFPTVYGLVDKKVWRLSPVSEPVDDEAVIDENPASLAGCSDGSSSAWLYFYKGNSTKKQILKEWSLGDGGLGSGMDDITVAPNSNLAAVYVGGPSSERRVIYQAPASATGPGALKVTNPDTGGDNPVLQTDNVRERSPIAACMAGPDDTTQRIHVYYVNGANTVYRVLSKVNNWIEWEEPAARPAFATKPIAFTQIAVTPVPAEKANYVTYVVDVSGKSTFRTFKDPW